MRWPACASVEDALGIAVPPTAELIRNIMMTTQYVQDHVIHFYHLHALDWVDIVNALKADPKKAAELAQSFSKWDKNTPAYFTAVQDKIKAFAASGLGIFANGYWGHPAYKLPPEVNLIAVAHYLDALEWQKEIVKIHAVFGGKNPHPNYLVGGVPCSIDVDEVAAINSERLNLVSRLICQADEFVNEVYIPDLLAVASFYKDWAKYGGGLKNYLCYGEFPTKGYGQPESFKYARGAVLNRDLSTVHPVNPRDAQEIKEYIAHSWYTYDGGDERGHSSVGGRNEDRLQRAEAAVRDAGGLRQVFVPEDAALERQRDGSGSAGAAAGFVCRRARGCEGDWSGMVLGKLNVPVDALFSTLGRTAARGIDAALAMIWLKEFFGELMDRVKINEVSTFNGEKWEPKTWPAECGRRGPGRSSARRAGALDQDPERRDRQLPTGGADHVERLAARRASSSARRLRQSLIGTPVANLEQPVEIIRTIHSFDPCLACAVHLYDPQGRHLHQVSFE